MEFVKLKDWFQNLDFEVAIKKIQSHDDVVDLVISLNDEKVYAEVKREVRPQHLAVFEGMAEQRSPFLVAADYITPNAKSHLKAKKINYIDSFGNAYINLTHLKVYIEKDNARPIGSEHSNVFTPTAGQVIFQLLKNPERINATQRQLSHISNVSLGSVSKCLQGLIDEGYVVKWSQDQKYQLVRKEELLDKWIILLNEKILPAHKIGTYKFSKSHAVRWNEQFINSDVRWAGEPAAALLTNYLNPEKFSLFTNTRKHNITKDLRLLPDANGDINIYRPFWVDDEKIGQPKNYMSHENVVHPLIIYAQLVYSGNNRNIETAQLLFNEYIQPNLQGLFLSKP
ncbi:type IV toxin-antitoxin system AbiEi family antitoxin [Gelidibacter japonicus]|uniref:type IV toxin-antitoxin system AbiEi family antitoxin n=1 Tax=Gelidibacter japonicus TaxID=1962232 RepID=UPI002021C958|nr:type IV toxin-antitoxin system AbiEi family antitoxin [Gelidibacter japonicus]MCL8008641.1 type IV toxin-antitoxin system AbiEi family antitoxin [Gelidibacter japonicus]